MTNAIEFQNVTAGYHGAPILRDLTLQVPEGEFAAVIGPNGAGKTTLLRVATGLLHPLQGEVRLFGKTVSGMNHRERAHAVGVIPQDMETPMAFTVAEVAMIGRTATLSRWSQPSAEDRRIVERAMVFADVVDMKHRPFSELSGGEKQRAIIAMVLAQQPRTILMDEATSHLDMNHRLEVMQIVERLNREEGVTVLMVSHDLNLSAEFCRRLILLDHGQQVADGTPAEVLNEDSLRRVYHCDVRVQHNATSGSVTVIPAPRLTGERSGRGIRVHVIAGGGCGEEVLRCLCLRDYIVSCGVLNQLDSDAEVSDALNISMALEKPFSPIGPQAADAARLLIRSADAVVVCGVPFGPGNVINLELALEALAEKKTVLFMEGIAERDHTPGRDAEKKARLLADRGAVSWRTLPDLLSALPANPVPMPGNKTSQETN